MTIAVTLVFFKLSYSFYQLFSVYTDDSAIVGVCPRAYDLDSPVKMDLLGKNHNLKDKWLKGFVRKVLTYNYPRSGNDVEVFYKYLSSHSLGSDKIKYLARLDEISEIKRSLESGNFAKFYPEDSKDVKIRPLDENTWKVQIDGYLKQRLDGKVSVTTPTISFEVETGKITKDNPEGLYFSNYQVEEIYDFVTGRKRDRKKGTEND